MMEYISNEKLTEFLMNFPLYKKCKLIGDFDSFDFDKDCIQYLVDKSFKSICIAEKQLHTFRLEIYPEILKHDGYRNFAPIKRTQINNGERFDYQELFSVEVHFKGRCQSCLQYTNDIILRIFNDNPLKGKVKINQNRTQKFEGVFEQSNVYIEKIGQYPAYSITPSKVISQLLNTEDQENYKKALISLSQSYGIGAYAYLRRIIENEIDRFVEGLIEIEYEGSENIKSEFEKLKEEIKSVKQQHEKDHRMSNFLDSISQYLPSSIKIDGENPLKLLYEQLSGGIHNFSEEECLEKAGSIKMLLPFVIQRINEEKNNLSPLRDSIKKLKGK